MPCPVGLAYDPYQIAAVEYALRIFGELDDESMSNVREAISSQPVSKTEIL